MFRVPLIGCRKTRHQPHQPLIGSEMPVDMVAEVRLTGLSFGLQWQHATINSPIRIVNNVFSINISGTNTRDNTVQNVAFT